MEQYEKEYEKNKAELESRYNDPAVIALQKAYDLQAFQNEIMQLYLNEYRRRGVTIKDMHEVLRKIIEITEPDSYTKFTMALRKQYDR